MTRTTSLFLAAAAAMLGTAALPGGAPLEPLQVKVSNRDAQWPSPVGLTASAATRRGAAVRALSGGWHAIWRGWQYPKPGHSVRQGQRMACKRRNAAAHRRACRMATRRRA